MAAELIRVEVAYAASAQQQTLLSVTLPATCTVQQAIEASHILQQHPEIDLTQQKTGIFGQITTLSQTVNEGDRVEIYRGLLQDPMTARRQRVLKK